MLNRQLVILFAGVGGLREIWVFSRKDKVFTKSKIKGPEKNRGKALAVNDPKHDESPVFVKSQWSKCGIYDQKFPPRHLIKIMQKYYLNEQIHLIDRSHGKHWKIDVFAIINNIV